MDLKQETHKDSKNKFEGEALNSRPSLKLKSFRFKKLLALIMALCFLTIPLLTLSGCANHDIKKIRDGKETSSEANGTNTRFSDSAESQTSQPWGGGTTSDKTKTTSGSETGGSTGNSSASSPKTDGEDTFPTSPSSSKQDEPDDPEPTAGEDTRPPTKVPDTTSAPKPTAPPKPDPAGEFKGVWFTYIEQADLLASGNADSVKAGTDRIMDNIKNSGFNAVFWHVRSHSDAYYKSGVFNANARAKTLLDKGFDPLEYAVESAHKRGLEIHAWVNPYRIGSKIEFAELSGNDIFLYSGNYYYNPASEACKNLIVRGIDEIVKNYNVDGIQFDDYFYPQGAVTDGSAAPYEEKLYNDYKNSGGKLSLKNWRISHVNSMIKSVYNTVHKKSGYVFGISPRAVISQNLSLYADAEEWMAYSGYIDYILPQVYFGFKNSSSAFSNTVDLWANLKRHSSVKLYIGIAAYKMDTEDTWAGSGKFEWKESDDILEAMVIEIRRHSSCDGLASYRYSDLLVTDNSLKGRAIKKFVSALFE